MEFNDVSDLVGEVLWIKMQIIDLKKQKGNLIDQYIQLRNSYTELLLTSSVDILNTEKWLEKNYDIEIKGLAEDGILLGVVILYLNRNGEIAFFVKNQNRGRGIGNRLISIIEEVAREKRLRFIWGWVLKDNFSAQGTFKKNRFIEEEIGKREYKGVIKEGIKYIKFLH